MRSRVVAIAAAACVACSPEPERAPIGESAQALISDGVHGAGTEGFVFVPPLVPCPYGVDRRGQCVFTAPADRTVLPIVRVDEIDDIASGRTLRTLHEWRRDQGRGEQRLRLGAQGIFAVRWNARADRLDPARTYRIRVLNGTRQLGFADVDVVRTSGELRNVNTNELVPLLLGRSLTIRFRVETTLTQPPRDTDLDGVLDDRDDCPEQPDPLQLDSDRDGVGDACECIDDDATDCAGTRYDVPLGECVDVPANTGLPCDDGDACTSGTVCGGLSCGGGAPVSCDDGNPCSSDACDRAAGCTHAPGNTGALCRAAAGECDAPEDCDGVSLACPPDLARPLGEACRPSAGACDPAEVCDGMSNACPPDLKSTAECRPRTGQCDVAEACDGTGAACPADASAADGSACDDGDACTSGDACLAGLCAPGAPLPCDDGDPCTDDGCDRARGCTHATRADGPFPGSVATTCGAGACAAAGRTECASGIVVDTCVPACTGTGCPAFELGSVLGESVAVGSTLDQPDHHASCGFTGSADVAYGWSAPHAGRFVFDLRGSSYDTVLEVTGQACDGPVLACVDDFFGLVSRVELPLQAGERVVIWVDGFPDAAGTYRLNINELEVCDNGVDDDGDGLVDCAEPQCAALYSCMESRCDDRTDNDRDGLVDCADPDCAAELYCYESSCTDGLDNDSDGAVDCLDAECAGNDECFEIDCGDRVDDDRDGLFDCADPDCAGRYPCTERCDDGLDNDRDGASDCADPDCADFPACRPGGPIGPGLLLNEIGFEAPFVEIVNAGVLDVPLAGAALVNARGERFTFPPEALPLGAGDVAVASLPSGFLAAVDDLTLLASDGTTADAIAWGEDDGLVPRNPGVPLAVGGVVHSTPPPGSILVRPRFSISTDFHEWSLQPASDATPGAPNLQPRVLGLIPESGTIFEGGSLELRWYTVPGAVSYRVQVALDAAFTMIVADVIVAGPPFVLDGLTEASYHARVSAIDAGGVASAFSDSIEAVNAAHRPRVVRRVTAGVTPEPQRKDSRMILLESDKPAGDAHGYNHPHGAFDSRDEADRMNCGLASIAMINHRYGGNLTQDRIGYEHFKKFTDHEHDPNDRAQGDLNWGYGVSDFGISNLVEFALGGRPIKKSGALGTTTLWDDVVHEVEAGRPLIISTASHTMVINGFEIDEQQGRWLVLANPQPGKEESRPISELQPSTNAFQRNSLAFWYVLPMSPRGVPQEASVDEDPDNDGVVTFDEVERFHTDPRKEDTDGDRRKDGREIEQSMFEPGHGFALYQGSRHDGRDFDHDGKTMESDFDSDDGGCYDGLEDKEHRSNFNRSDDDCVLSGWSEEAQILDTVADESRGIHAGHSELRHRGEFSLKWATYPNARPGDLDGRITLHFKLDSHVDCTYGGPHRDSYDARWVARSGGVLLPADGGAWYFIANSWDPPDSPPIQVTHENVVHDGICEGTRVDTTTFHFTPAIGTMTGRVYDHVENKPFGPLGPTSTGRWTITTHAVRGN